MALSLHFMQRTIRPEPIPNVLDALAAGHMVVVADDEDRENEGDLICAAERITAEKVNFMLSAARGLLCLALDPRRIDALGLPPMVRPTGDDGPAFTVSIDAHSRFGVTSGTSAGDRATTIRLTANTDAVPEDFHRPGHVFPLRAHGGGLAARQGHTEATVELVRQAGLAPAGALIEVLQADGSMARTSDLQRFCRQHHLMFTTIEMLADYVRAIEKAPPRAMPLAPAFARAKLAVPVGQSRHYT